MDEILIKKSTELHGYSPLADPVAELEKSPNITQYSTKDERNKEYARIVSAINTSKQSFDFNRKNFSEPSNFGFDASGAALLTLDQKRRILKMRYRKLVATGNNAEFNSYSNILTGDLGMMIMSNGPANMEVTYKFNFTVPVWMQYAINTFDILPTPAGVKQTITY